MLAEYITLDSVATQLSQIKEQLFSGCVLLKSSQGQEWYLHFYLGRILYATGGTHPTRRWVRNCRIAKVDSGTGEDLQTRIRSLTDISALTRAEMNSCWEYYLLVNWAKQSRISRNGLVQMIQSTIVEVLFDILRTTEVSWELLSADVGNNERLRQQNEARTALNPQLTLIDVERALGLAQQQRQQWDEANLMDICPDRGIEIVDVDGFRKLVNERVFLSLKSILNGQYSIREIAVKTHKSPMAIGRSFSGYIRAGHLRLVEPPDFDDPIEVYLSQLRAEPPLIACIDDSPFVCDRLEQIFRSQGYNFLGILDSTRAIPLAIAKKPHLIFLDLVMPNTNGYEICNRLRKVEAFQNTPIVILTGNDGVIDRVRAKVVGATDFLTKPVQSELVLEIAEKYLKAIVYRSN
jgi:two-component system, chemotaxis family, response regulator PixG